MVQLADSHSFEAVFRKQYSGLFTRAWRFVQDGKIAEDIVHDVFSHLWQKRGELIISTSVAAYLHATTVNYALTYLKGTGAFEVREMSLSTASGKNTATTKDAGPKRETSEVIPYALDKLTDGCRAIFVLSHFENLSSKAIALQLNISDKTVDNQLSRALKIFCAEPPVFSEQRDPEPDVDAAFEKMQICNTSPGAETVAGKQSIRQILLRMLR